MIKTELSRVGWYLFHLCFFLLVTGVQAEQSGRIFGGTKTNSEWSYMVGVFYKSVPDNYEAQFCGGTLISDKWVVTAAHCFEMYEYSTEKISYKRYDETDVSVGYVNLNSLVRQGVRRIIKHPLFDPVSLENDIALIELEQAVEKAPLTLYSGTSQLIDEEAVLLGWGQVEPGNDDYPFPDYLYEATAAIPSNLDCNQAYRNHPAYDYYPITPGMICAGDEQGWAVDTCEGDSGGPLIVTVNGTEQLAGITSWGESCAEESLYGVYTRVSEYTDFVAEVKESATVRGVVTAFNIIGETVPVKGAKVIVDGRGVTDVTDENGQYSAHVSSGNHMILIASSQYGSRVLAVTAATGEIITFSPQLTDINGDGDSFCFIQTALNRFIQ